MPSPQWRLIVYMIFFAAILITSKTEDIQNDPSFVDLCPSAGNVGDRFNIDALGRNLPRLGGCATKQLSNQIDFWIGYLELGDSHCPPIGSNYEHYGMEHYIFDCKNAWYAKQEQGDVNRFVYATLQERTPHILGSSVFKCSMYEQKEGITMRLAIAENNNCTGLRERLTQAPNSKLLKNTEWMDGFIVLDFSPHIERTRRRKRSPERTTESTESINSIFKIGKWIKFISELIPSVIIVKKKSEFMKWDVPQCRFPDWTQGQWMNLKIKGGEASYEYTFDDVEENIDETDQDNEESVNIENITKNIGARLFDRLLTRVTDDTTPLWRYRRFVNNEHTTTQRPTKTESTAYDSRVNKKVAYKNQEISLENLKNPREIYGEGQRNRRSIFPKTSVTDDTTSLWRYRRFVYDEHTTTQRPTKTKSITHDSRVNKTVNYKNQEISLENLKNPREIYGEGQRNRRSIFSKTSVTDDTTPLWRYRRFVNNDLTIAQHKNNVSADVETDYIHQSYEKLFKSHINIDQVLPTVNASMRRKRIASQRDQQIRAKSKFTWSCTMSVDYDDNQPQPTEKGAKFLTWGRRYTQERSVITGNGSQNEKETLVDIEVDGSMTYVCLWIKPRGPNILEFSIIGTGLPTENQDMTSFARELCNNNKGSHNSWIRYRKKFRPLRQMWRLTETQFSPSKQQEQKTPASSPPENSVVVHNASTLTIVYYLSISMVVVVFNHFYI